MAFSPWLAQSTRTAGTYQIPSRAVPAGLSRVSMRLVSTNWTQAARTINLSAEASMDGGTTWVSFGSATFQGGTVLAKDGVSPGVRQFDVLLPADNYPTHLRMTAVIAGGSINVGVDGEVA